MIKAAEAFAGNIVLWDGEKKEKIIIEQEEYETDSFFSTRYTPIGIVVIPASHMPDGKARMMSTRWMNSLKPDSGSEFSQYMCWGKHGEVSGLSNFNEIPTIQSDENQTVESINDKAFLPSNYSGFSGFENSKDSGTKWSRKKWHEIAPSPYNSDGTPNPLYRTTEFRGKAIHNPLSDFDGRGNTDKIIAVRGERNYNSWNPSRCLPEDFPAASCCDMYYTIGTKQGDWYLPSCGELGYTIARLSDIINSLRMIRTACRPEYELVWSSTTYDSKKAFLVAFDNGEVVWSLKKLDAVVIAFSIIG